MFLRQYNTSKQSHKVLYVILLNALVLAACNKDIKHFSTAAFQSQFDTAQARLDSEGNPSAIPAGNAAQSPQIQLLSLHYLELLPDALTPYKKGAQVYRSPETDKDGALAIDFDSAVLVSENEVSITVNINRIANNTYNYVRASVSYLRFGVDLTLHNVPVAGDIETSGTVAAFLEYNTFIGSLQLDSMSAEIHANKPQGFWALASQLPSPYASYNALYTGQCAGVTTVVNPIFATSPLPPSSGIITGKFSEPLVIDDETKQQDLTITLVFSINNSFEWEDQNGDLKWDVDAMNPALTEPVMDMGLRGMIPAFRFDDSQ